MNWVVDAYGNFREEVGAYVASVEEIERRFTFGKHEDHYMAFRDFSCIVSTLINSFGALPYAAASIPEA